MVVGQVKTVDSGELSFANPNGLTPDEAKQWVIEQARIRALANAFGTRVQSETVMTTSESNGTLDEAFTEMNVSQVKGEWVQTLEVNGPSPFIQEDGIWWKVRIRGKARPVTEDRVELELALVGDVEARVPVESLMDGDRIRCAFASPVDGHALLFYLESGLAYVLAEDATSWSVEIQGQQSYSLFSPSHEWLGIEAGHVAKLEGYDYGFQAVNSTEVDLQGMLILAFSTEKFSPPMAKDQTDIFTLSEEAFERWIRKKSASSDAFQIERLPIRIRAKKQY